jgi:hypothetical protein
MPELVGPHDKEKEKGFSWAGWAACGGSCWATRPIVLGGLRMKHREGEERLSWLGFYPGFGPWPIEK